MRTVINEDFIWNRFLSHNATLSMVDVSGKDRIGLYAAGSMSWKITDDNQVWIRTEVITQYSHTM